MGDAEPQDITRLTGSRDSSQAIGFQDAIVHESQPINPQAASFQGPYWLSLPQTTLLVCMRNPCLRL